MKIKLFIFALLLVGCDDMISPNCEFDGVSLIISPASPVEFWPTNCQSHNEKEICGVFPKCFCAPWECDDEIKIPGVDQITDDLYSLAILDSDSNEINRVEFVQQELLYAQESDDLDDFENVDTGTSWTIDADPSVSLADGGAFAFIRSKIAVPKNQFVFNTGSTYVVNFNMTWDDAVSSSLRTVLLDKDDNILVSVSTVLTPSAGTTSDTVTFNDVPAGAVKFGFYLTRVGTGTAQPNIDLTLNNYSINRIVYSHLASFIPSELDPAICDQQIFYKIYNITSSPDEEIYHSDCQDIKEDQSCTNMVDYSNNRNIAGIIYTEGSPALTLSVRVPSTMRVQQFPEEDIAVELTQTIEKINGFVKAQTLFEVDYVPYYFHRKLKMIFKHQFIHIDGKYWTKEDDYVITEDNRKLSLKTGEVFLTERDFAFRVPL